MSLRDLSRQVKDVLLDLEAFWKNNYDDRAPIGAPLGPRLRLDGHAKEAWVTYWTGVLAQFEAKWNTEYIVNTELSKMLPFVLESASVKLTGTVEIVVGTSPLNILEHHPNLLEQILNEYVSLLDKPVTGYLVWPLQLGRGGNHLEFSPFQCENTMFFQGATLPEKAKSRSRDIEDLMNIAQQRQFPSLIRSYPSEAYLYLALADECTEAVIKESRANLYAFLCSLRLSSSGDIAATQSCLLFDPVELLHGCVQVSGDVPSPLPGGRVPSPWPQGMSVQEAVGRANEIYRLLSSIDGLTEDLNNISVSWSSRNEGMSVTIRDPYPVNLVVKTWLGFALQLLEYTYTRTDLEGIVHCWAILEALFVLPNERSKQDTKNAYKHGTADKVAIRFLVLETPKGQQEQQEFYNEIRTIADARNTLAHGKEKSERRITMSILVDFRDVVRTSLLSVICWVGTRGQGASYESQRALLKYLDEQRKDRLEKDQEEYYDVYENLTKGLR